MRDYVEELSRLVPGIRGQRDFKAAEQGVRMYVYSVLRSLEGALRGAAMNGGSIDVNMAEKIERIVRGISVARLKLKEQKMHGCRDTAELARVDVELVLKVRQLEELVRSDGLAAHVDEVLGTLREVDRIIARRGRLA